MTLEQLKTLAAEMAWDLVMQGILSRDEADAAEAVILQNLKEALERRP